MVTADNLITAFAKSSRTKKTYPLNTQETN